VSLPGAGSRNTTDCRYLTFAQGHLVDFTCFASPKVNPSLDPSLPCLFGGPDPLFSQMVLAPMVSFSHELHLAGIR
jgi:hypothetical protein